MLQRLRNNNNIDIQIIETDYPQVKEVDLKLIELGQELDAVIVTNDFNLNKVSQLRGVSVLNINELANALKPVVLPGEAMRVFILKEGKEYNQGVAYLDDGTMVVVDNARRLIGKTADVAVTSVFADDRRKNDFRQTLGRKRTARRFTFKQRQRPRIAHDELSQIFHARTAPDDDYRGNRITKN